MSVPWPKPKWCRLSGIYRLADTINCLTNQRGTRMQGSLRSAEISCFRTQVLSHKTVSWCLYTIFLRRKNRELIKMKRYFLHTRKEYLGLVWIGQHLSRNLFSNNISKWSLLIRHLKGLLNHPGRGSQRSTLRFKIKSPRLCSAIQKSWLTKLECLRRIILSQFKLLAGARLSQFRGRSSPTSFPEIAKSPQLCWESWIDTLLSRAYSSPKWPKR